MKIAELTQSERTAFRRQVADELGLPIEQVHAPNFRAEKDGLIGYGMDEAGAKEELQAAIDAAVGQRT